MQRESLSLLTEEKESYTNPNKGEKEATKVLQEKPKERKIQSPHLARFVQNTEILYLHIHQFGDERLVLWLFVTFLDNFLQNVLSGCI